MLLTVENLNLIYDKKKIFNSAAFRILPNEKVGIIGHNGAGKSTLINVLCNKIIPDSGIIEFDKNIKVGYLDQYMNVDGKMTIDYYLKQAFFDLYEENKKLEEINELLVDCQDNILLDRYIRNATNIRESLEEKDFYLIDSKVGRISAGLGLINYGLDTKIKNLSGGQKIKVILAKLLLEEPDLLILDEPTNFLDTVHIDWLVKYLKEYKGNFLIVSHHSEFLNDVVNVILEIDLGKITKYKGNYQDYLQKKALNDAVYEKKYNAQKKEIKALNDYIQKNKVKTSTARQAKSREKRLDKIEVLEKLQSSDIHLNLSFNYTPIFSAKFLVCENLEIGYNDYSLLPPISFTIRSGEKLAITGFNGIGKSTLIKTLVGIIPVVKGKFHFVNDKKIAYFEQELNFDNMEISALNEIQNLYPRMDNSQVRSQLARCGLTNDAAIRPLKTLSGGELSKLKLCKIMLTEANVLILDEPTNHLDKIAKEELLNALKKYNGTVIFVSHDQFFVENLATKIYNIEELLLN